MRLNFFDKVKAAAHKFQSAGVRPMRLNLPR